MCGKSGRLRCIQPAQDGMLRCVNRRLVPANWASGSVAWRPTHDEG
ncbi:hypothetical protein SFOMI_1778 [Sphingobium fuliginis]|uniref:Uncharacterized protein n=1 Tax=Sphingobium fuliginis (strain ATCC 27551) TaxID=336203 RepID=A0A292ZEC9_SPHSA|nr:hypothetical protein SFOMI_1778 [Sphingobium fuliginis]